MVVIHFPGFCLSLIFIFMANTYNIHFMQTIEICRLYELDHISSNIMKVCGKHFLSSFVLFMYSI